jgi:hypothetical protein
VGSSGRVSSYYFCFGDSPDSTRHYNSSGSFSIANDVIQHSNRGIFTAKADTARNLGSIADGTSNTIAISEVTICPPTGTVPVGGPIKGGPARKAGTAWTTYDSTTRTTNVHDCWATKSGNQYISWNPTGMGDPGGLWSDCKLTATGFSTILPPNGPSCYGDNSADDVITTPSSYHTGGVVAGMADGSVRFVSETIESGDPATGNVVTSGVSEFGVWGAMGTIDGGESKSP